MMGDATAILVSSFFIAISRFNLFSI